MRRRVVVLLFVWCAVVLPAAAVQTRLTDSQLFYCEAGGGDKVYFVKKQPGISYDLWRMNADGTSAQQLTGDPGAELYLKLYASNTKMAYIKVSAGRDEVCAAGSDGADQKSIYSTTRNLRGIAVSPDATMAAFIELDYFTDPSYGQLCIANLDGSGNRSLAPARTGTFSSGDSLQRMPVFAISGTTLTARNVKYSQFITFSPDSRKIAYINRSGYLSSIGVDGTGQVAISSYTAENPVWLANNLIAHTRIIGSNYVIGLIDASGSAYGTLYSTTGAIEDLTVSPSQTVCAFNCNNNVVIVSSTGTLISTIVRPDSDDASYTLAWLSDTKLAYGNLKDIYIYDLLTGQATALTANDKEPGWNIKDARGSKVILSNEGNVEHYVINTDGTGRKLVLRNVKSSDIDSMKLTEAGDKLFYTKLSTGAYYYDIFVRSADDTGTDTLIAQQTLSYYTQWFPAGDRLMYYQYATSPYGYVIATADGATKKPFTFPEFSSISYPLISADGTQILFRGTNRTGGYSVAIAPVDLSTYTVVMTTASSVSLYDWKGSQAVMANTGLNLLNTLTGAVIPIDSQAYNSMGKLNRDGSKLAYPLRNATDGNNYLMTINTDGTGKTQLSVDPCNSFVWAEDGTQILANLYSRGQYSRFFLVNADGTGLKDINPNFVYGYYPYAVSGNKFVYEADSDIWAGDADPATGVPPTVSVPRAAGSVKVVVPQDGGERGTINPDSGKPVSIGFAGSGAGKYTLRIFTQFGEQVYSDTQETTDASGWFSWIPGDLASGVYLVTVEGPGLKDMRKIAILR